MDAGVTINRPPRDGYMAFVRTPDLISIELLQDGGPEGARRAVGVDAQHRGMVMALPTLEVARVPVLDDNYVWIVHDDASGETLVIDPGEAAAGAAGGRGARLEDHRGLEHALAPRPYAGQRGGRRPRLARS